MLDPLALWMGTTLEYFQPEAKSEGALAFVMDRLIMVHQLIQSEHSS